VFVLEVVVGAIVVLGVAVLLAAAGSGLPAAPPDSPGPALPSDRLLSSTDIAGLRLRTALRGYRMEDVDAVLSAVHASLWAAEHAASAGAEAELGAGDAGRAEPRE
jgi:DivIVA domain-containing protein